VSDYSDTAYACGPLSHDRLAEQILLVSRSIPGRSNAVTRSI